MSALFRARSVGGPFIKWRIQAPFFSVLFLLSDFDGIRVEENFSEDNETGFVYEYGDGVLLRRRFDTPSGVPDPTTIITYEHSEGTANAGAIAPGGELFLRARGILQDDKSEGSVLIWSPLSADRQKAKARDSRRISGRGLRRWLS